MQGVPRGAISLSKAGMPVSAREPTAGIERSDAGKFCFLPRMAAARTRSDRR